MKPSVLFYFSVIFVLGLQIIYFDKFINSAEFLHFFVSDWMRKNQTKQVKSRMACSTENRTESKQKAVKFLTLAYSRQAGSTIKI